MLRQITWHGRDGNTGEAPACSHAAWVEHTTNTMDRNVEARWERKRIEQYLHYEESWNLR